MENSDFSFFPDLSTWLLRQRTMTKLLKNFKRAPLNEIKNTPKKADHEEKSKLRFASPVDSQQVASATTPFVPKNTARQTQWSVSVQWLGKPSQLASYWRHWKSAWQVLEPCWMCYQCTNVEHVADQVRSRRNPEAGWFFLSCWNGLLSTVWRHLVSQFGGGNVPNFMAKKNNAATDKHYRKLRQEGVGTSINQAEPISTEEGVLWSSGVLGSHSPKSLLNAVFFLKGKNFALRDTEQYHLRISQLKRVEDPDGYVYVRTGRRIAVVGNRTSRYQIRVWRPMLQEETAAMFTSSICISLSFLWTHFLKTSCICAL